MVGDELGGAVDDSDGNPGDTFPITMYTRIAGVNVTSWQWARSRDMTDWDNIGTGGMYTVMDDDAGYYLRATATYTDGEGRGKMASEETKVVKMTTMNAAPMFESETDTREVAENTAAGEDIGNPVAANDANGDTLAYTLGGTDVASFDIGSATGQKITKAALDYEAKAMLRGHGHGHRPRPCKRHDHGDHHRHQRGRAVNGDPVGGDGCPHDAAAGWRHNHGGLWRTRTTA